MTNVPSPTGSDERSIRARRGGRHRATSRRSGEDGFILLESLLSIALVTVIMGALTTLFITTNQTTTHLRLRQQAIQLADTGIEQARAYSPSVLKAGRDSVSVATQYNAVTSTGSPALYALLHTMSITWDPTAVVGAGLVPVVTPAASTSVCGTSAAVPSALHLPTSPVCQAVGGRAFTMNYYVGSCYIPVADSTCTATQPSATAYLSYLRVVVAVSWPDSHCTSSSCTYLTSTLLNDSPDPKFDIPHPILGSPSILVSDRVSDVGDTGPYDSLTLTGGAGVAPFSWSATGLPPGLSMASDGSISGTIGDQTVDPKADSINYSVNVTVVDGLIQQKTASFTWTVQRPWIKPLDDQETQINTPVSLQLSKDSYSCNNGPCKFTLNNAPLGLSIDSAGLITGTPTVAGTLTTTITITDVNGITDTSDPFRWAVLQPATVCVPEIALANGSFEGPVVSHGAPNWLTGGSSPLLWDTTEPDNVIELWKNDGAGNQTGLTVQAANGGMAISAEDGSQWAELNANQTGALYQNLPTVSGQILQWSVWHRGRYSNAANASKKDVMEVQIGSTASQAVQTPTGQTTTDISDGPDAWKLYRGIYTVPAGQTVTRFQFAAKTTASGDNSVGNFIDNLSLNNYVACLNNAPQAQFSTVNTPINALQLSASRGSGSFTWAGGKTLPPGLTISTDGRITGTPTVVGTTPVVLTLTDNQTAFEQSVSFNWTVAPRPTVNAPAAQITSQGGVVTLQVSTGCQNTPCSYAIDGGPAGLTVTNTGVVLGTVTSTPQVFSSVTITVRDNVGVTATTAGFSWTIVGSPTYATPGNQKTLRGAAVSLSTSSRVTGGTGGTGGYRYFATGLPAWLSINSSTGQITGTAPATDSTTSGITLTVTDSSGASATTTPFSWNVYGPPTVATPADRATSVGSAVNFALSVSCPNGPCSYTFNGNAPTGLTISNTGVVTGTTSVAKNFTSITVTATDSGGASTTSGAFTWTVNPAPKIVSPGNQRALHGAAVSLAMATYASGGTGTYAYSAKLPTWLTINSATGVISGTAPTGADTTTTGITVTLTDATGVASTTATFTWTVNNSLVTSFSTQSAYKQTAVNLDLDNFTTGGTGPYTYSASGLPSWLTLNRTTGALTGTAPTVAANSTTTTSGITITVTDSLGTATRSAAFNWYVTDLIWTGLAANGSTLSTQQGTSVNGLNAASYVAGGSAGARTYLATSLPTGVSVASNGAITGTASTRGTWRVVLAVTDAAGATSNSVITWNVT